MGRVAGAIELGLLGSLALISRADFIVPFIEIYVVANTVQKTTEGEIKASISLIVYDFDGVMTDNRVLVSEDGTESVTCNRADGLGIGYIRELGIPQLILSTETNPVVTSRAGKLDVPVIQGCGDKRSALKEYCEQHDYLPKQVLYVGNDLNDLEVMNMVGYPVAPSDAHPSILSIATMVTKAKGGAGVIKELAENLGSIKPSSR